MSIRHKTSRIVFTRSAIGSVLGGVTNSIVAGHVAGFLVSVRPWQIGSAFDDRRFCESP
jgi:hypothetical protein